MQQKVIVGISTNKGSRGQIVRVIGPFYDNKHVERFVEELNKQNDGMPQKGMVWRKVHDELYIDDERERRYAVEPLYPSDTYIHKELATS